MSFRILHRTEYHRSHPRTRRALYVLLFIALSCVGTFTAYGLSFKPITLEQAVKGADLIVDVTIGAQSTVTQEHPQRGKTLKTLSALKVNQVIKGSISAPITVSQVGGEHQGFTQVIPGAPIFKEGQRWVLFLRQLKATSEWVVTAGQHGASQVWVRDTDQAEMISIAHAAHSLKRLRRLRSLKSQLRVLPNKKLREVPMESSASKTPVAPTSATPKKVSTTRSEAVQVKPQSQTKPQPKPQSKPQAKPQAKEAISGRIKIPTLKRASLKAKARPNIKLTPGGKRKLRSVKLKAYIEKLKTLVDRTQAPERPTH